MDSLDEGPSTALGTTQTFQSEYFIVISSTVRDLVHILHIKNSSNAGSIF